MVELIGLLKKDNKTIEVIEKIKIDRIIKMIKLLVAGKINSKQAKTIIAEIYKTLVKNKTNILRLTPLSHLVYPFNFYEISRWIIGIDQNQRPHFGFSEKLNKITN